MPTPVQKKSKTTLTNESFLDHALGYQHADVLRNKLNKHFAGDQNKKTEQHFIANFIKDAMPELAKAVAKAASTQQAQSQSPGPQPEQPQTTNTKRAVGAPNTDPYEVLKGQVRRLQPRLNAKPLTSNIIAELQNDIQKLAKGDKESGEYAAKKILKLAAAGYDVSKLTPNWLAGSKANERFLTQSIYRVIDKILKECNITWANLGLKIRLTESVSGRGVFLATCSPVPVNYYTKLNRLFESIVNELDATQQPIPNPIIVQEMSKWFIEYMSGVDISNEKAKSIIKEIINQVALTYNSKDKGIAALTYLGRVAYKLTVASPRASSYSRSQLAAPQYAGSVDAASVTRAKHTLERMTPQDRQALFTTMSKEDRQNIIDAIMRVQTI